MKKINSYQRRAQAQAAWDKLDREAERIAAEQEIPKEDAVAAVFADSELLAKVHDVPPAESFPEKPE